MCRPIFLLLLFATQALMVNATLYQIFRDHPGAPLGLSYIPDRDSAFATGEKLSASCSRFIIEGYKIDIEVCDDYIIADTFIVSVNGRDIFTCYYDDDDHQAGKLIDVYIVDNICRLTAGAHTTCIE